MTKSEFKNLINECVEEILEEDAFLNESVKYNLMRKSQTSTIGLTAGLNEQKKICKKKFDECKSNEDYKKFISWLDKQKSLMNKKINGKEIKNKNILHKYIELYDSYIEKCNNAMK